MIRTIARATSFTIIVAMALAATTALAQETRVSGTVSRVDTVSRTIYFADGSAVRVQPGTVIMMNGHAVPLEALQPGTDTTVVSTAPTTGAVAAQPSVAAQPAQPAVDVVGTVAQVDRQSGTITLQDGRQVNLSSQSVVWQATPISSIQPGTQIYVHNAQPLAMGAPQTYDPNMQIGTVKSVDQANRLIGLNDGTFAKVTPSTRLQSGGRPLTLAEVKPGDRVAIRPQGRPDAATRGPAGSPGLGAATTTVSRGEGPPVAAVEADYIEVSRSAAR
jgi:hypothetical protein